MTIYCPLAEALGIDPGGISILDIEDDFYDQYGNNLPPWNKGKKGLQVAWNKGIKTGPQPEEQIRLRAEAISKAQTGRKYPKTRVDNMRNAISKNWMITYPDGRTEMVRNLNQFCKDNGLYYANMWRVISGRKKHYKGYTVKEII